MPRPVTFIATIVLTTALVLLAMGRNLICACGRVELWHGAIDAGNSQHIADWYSLSHLVHGLFFYAAARWLLPRVGLWWRAVAATLVEAAWELAENTPMVIDRYREATIALGYTGDSVVNSLSDILFMLLGFALAARLPVRASLALAVGAELLAAWMIRDNLTLNVLMLLWPLEAVRRWQGG